MEKLFCSLKDKYLINFEACNHGVVVQCSTVLIHLLRRCDSCWHRSNIRFWARYDKTRSELLSLQHCKLTLAVDATPVFSLHRERKHPELKIWRSWSPIHRLSKSAFTSCWSLQQNGVQSCSGRLQFNLRHKKISCKNIVELKYFSAFLYKLKGQWENELTKTV